MTSVKELLKSVVPHDLHKYIPTSFDIIGSRGCAVAIVEIPEEIEAYKYEIAKAIARACKHVKTVLRRIGKRRGVYRLYEYEVLIQGPTEVVHKEHGYYIKVDPTKVYFSPRDQTDRLEISRMVSAGETILYMFAGVGPYAISICRMQPEVRLIVAVEINPTAVHYMIENIRLNKLRGKVVPIEGDVRHVCPKLRARFDRVLMTLPLGAHEFLDIGISMTKRGGYLHFYHIGHEDSPFREAEMLIDRYCRALGRDYNIVGRRVVRDYAPRLYKVRIDVEIL